MDSSFVNVMEKISIKLFTEYIIEIQWEDRYGRNLNYLACESGLSLRGRGGVFPQLL